MYLSHTEDWHGKTREYKKTKPPKQRQSITTLGKLEMEPCIATNSFNGVYFPFGRFCIMMSFSFHHSDRLFRHQTQTWSSSHNTPFHLAENHKGGEKNKIKRRLLALWKNKLATVFQNNPSWKNMNQMLDWTNMTWLPFILMVNVSHMDHFFFFLTSIRLWWRFPRTVWMCMRYSPAPHHTKDSIFFSKDSTYALWKSGSFSFYDLPIQLWRST